MRIAALASAVACTLVAGYLVAGTPALITLAVGFAVLGLLAGRAALPAAPPPRPRPPRAAEPDGLQAFASYRRISEAVSWSRVSARHHDTVTRPMLVRLLAAALADAYGVDLARDPDRAKALVGAELWPFLDPDRPASADSLGPGPDPRVLRLAVTRLEELWPPH